ncbi:hypothetical protein VIGAN_05212100, partial [Vigna angularis var. angularis]
SQSFSVSWNPNSLSESSPLMASQMAIFFQSTDGFANGDLLPHAFYSLLQTLFPRQNHIHFPVLSQEPQLADPAPLPPNLASDSPFYHQNWRISSSLYFFLL